MGGRESETHLLATLRLDLGRPHAPIRRLLAHALGAKPRAPCTSPETAVCTALLVPRRARLDVRRAAECVAVRDRVLGRVEGVELREVATCEELTIRSVTRAREVGAETETLALRAAEAGLVDVELEEGAEVDGVEEVRRRFQVRGERGDGGGEIATMSGEEGGSDMAWDALRLQEQSRSR